MYICVVLEGRRENSFYDRINRVIKQLSRGLIKYFVCIKTKLITYSFEILDCTFETEMFWLKLWTYAFTILCFISLSLLHTLVLNTVLNIVFCHLHSSFLGSVIHRHHLTKHLLFNTRRYTQTTTHTHRNLNHLFLPLVSFYLLAIAVFLIL